MGTALTLSRTFSPGPRGELLNHPVTSLWMDTVGCDAFYPLDEDGVYIPTLDHIAKIEHGVRFVHHFKGMVVDYTLVEWCECHSDHPVVAAATNGRILAVGTAEGEQLIYAAERAKQERWHRKIALQCELNALVDADVVADRELAEKLPPAQRRDAQHERSRRRRGVASARRRANKRATGHR